MTPRTLMTMRARITRPQSTQRDDYGHLTADTNPDEIEDAAPCYAWSPTDVREVLDTSQSVVGAVRFAMPLWVDVKQGDAILDVRDRSDRVVFGGPMQVTSVTRYGRARAVMARVQQGSV